MPLFSRNSSTAQQTAGSFNTDAVNAGADSLNQGPYVAPLRLSASTAQRMQHLHKPKDPPAVEVEWVLEVQQEPKLFTRGMLAQRHQQLGTEAISRVLDMVLTPEGCANAVGEGPDASVVMAIVVQTAPTGSYQQPPEMQHIWVLAHGDNLNGQLEPLFQDISTHLVGSSGGGAGRKGGIEGFRTYVGVKINVRKAVEERRARAQAEQGAGQIGEAEQDQVEVETVASSCAADLAALIAEENGHHAGHHVHRVDLSAMCGNGGPLVGPARVGKDGAQPAESTKPSSGDAKGGKDEKATQKEGEADKAATAGGDKLNGGRKADFWWWVKPKGRKRSNTVSETTEVAAASPPQTDNGTNDGDKATIDNINHTHDAAPAVSAHRDATSSIGAPSMSPGRTDLESSDLTSHGSRDDHHGHSESAGEAPPSPPQQEERAREGVAAAAGGGGVELDSLESYVQDVERSRSPVKEEKQQQHGGAHDDVDDHHHGDHGDERQHSSLPRTDPGEESHKACDHPHEHQWDEMHAANDDEAHKHKAGAGAHDENKEEKQEGDGHSHAESRMEGMEAEHGQQGTQEKEGEGQEEEKTQSKNGQDKGGDRVELQQPQQHGKHQHLKSPPNTEASSAHEEQAQQQPHHTSVRQATTAQPTNRPLAEREHQDNHGEEEEQKEHNTSQHGSPHQAPASPEPRLPQPSSSPEDQAKVSPPPSPHQQEEKEETDRHALPQQQQSPCHHNHHQQQHIVGSPHDRHHRHDQQQQEEDKADEIDEEEQGKEQEGEERKVEDDSRTRGSNDLSTDKHTDKPEEISVRDSTHDHEPLHLKDRVSDATAQGRTDKSKPTAHTDGHKRQEQGLEEEKKQKQRSAASKPKSRPHELWGVCGRFIIMSFIIVVLFGGVLGVMIARRPINGSLAIGQKLRVGDRLTYRCDKSVWRVSPSCVNLDLLVTNEGVLRLIENAGTSKEKLKWQSPRRRKPTVSTKYTASLDEKSRLVVELEGRAVFKTSPLIQNKYPEDDFPFISQPPGLHLDGVWGGFYVVPCPVASKPVEVTNPMSIG